MLLCSHVRKILFLIFTLPATVPSIYFPIYPLHIKYIFFIHILYLLSICYQVTITQVRNTRLSIEGERQVGAMQGKPMWEEGVIFAPCVSTVIGERSPKPVRCGQSQGREAMVKQPRRRWHLWNGPYAAGVVVVAVSSRSTAIKNTDATSRGL